MFEQSQQQEQGAEVVPARCRAEATAKAGGDPVATAARVFWEEFARRQGHDLLRCVAGAMRRVGWRTDPAEVEELAQEVYCRVLDGRLPPAATTGWPPAQLWGYLNRIARSVVVDELRTRCARKRGGARPGAADAAVGGAPVVTAPERRAPGLTPEERLLAREGARAVRRRVCELGAEHGPRNLRILELAAIEGCTAGEISARLAGALTPSSVHTVLYRLRHQLSVAPGPQLAALVER